MGKQAGKPLTFSQKQERVAALGRNIVLVSGPASSAKKHTFCCTLCSGSFERYYDNVVYHKATGCVTKGCPNFGRSSHAALSFEEMARQVAALGKPIEYVGGTGTAKDHHTFKCTACGNVFQRRYADVVGQKRITGCPVGGCSNHKVRGDPAKAFATRRAANLWRLLEGLSSPLPGQDPG